MDIFSPTVDGDQDVIVVAENDDYDVSLYAYEFEHANSIGHGPDF